MNKTTIAQQAKTANVLAPAQGILQRKCARGNHTIAGGECAECQKKKNNLQREPNDQRVLGTKLSLSQGLVMQRKLNVGASNDPLEQEADRVADQVIALPTDPAVTGAPPHIQRYADQPTRQADTVPASVDRVLASSGRSMDPVLQEDMGQRFGHDFSRVRVHSGIAAEQSARDVNALAYTVGHNIVFGAGRFVPETDEGRRLIAHELTHVVQQSAVGSAAFPLSSTGLKVQRRSTAPLTRNLDSMSDAELETEAQRVRAWLRIRGTPDLDYFPTVEYLNSIEAEQFARNKKVNAIAAGESEVPFGPPRPKPRIKYKYRANNFRPSTGIGHFDAVEYNSETEVLTITVRPKFNFTIRIDDYPSELRNDPAARRQLVKTLAARERAFIAAFSAQAEAWGGHHVFHCHNPGLEGVKAGVRIEVDEVKGNEPSSPDYSYTNVTVGDREPGFRPHAAFGAGSLNLSISDDLDMVYDAKTQAMVPQPKVPPLDLRQPGEFGSSSGGLAGLPEPNSTPKKEQYTSMHELGHLFGYGDEYVEQGKAGYAKGDPVSHSELVRREMGRIVTHGSNPNSIMSMGNAIGPEHGVTFLEALRSVTGLAWGLEPRTTSE